MDHNAENGLQRNWCVKVYAADYIACVSHVSVLFCLVLRDRIISTYRETSGRTLLLMKNLSCLLAR